MESKLKIIGITGGFGSGKSIAASFFESKGFKKITLSKFLEEEARSRDLAITRKNLQDIGNEWREKHGPGTLAIKALGFARDDKVKRLVIDGIRNIAEIEEFKKENFILLAIESSESIRFERLRELKRRENLTRELFKNLDRRDMGYGEKNYGLQVKACIERADIHIKNEGSLEEFEKKLEEVLDEK